MALPADLRSEIRVEPDLSSPRRVSVIVPCREEREFIGACLDSILANDYPRDRIEVLVVDGMSADGTRDIVARYAGTHPRVKLLDNPKHTVPAALNLGIAHARGDVIVRMDAHIEYPADYVSKLVAWLQRTGADNVGGVCVTLPSSDRVVARAIATALSHPFGIGDARFRLGTKDVRRVDTVPFGCFRREVFDRVGLFDEDLVRNQDDEFNHRLIRSGGRVILVPDVFSRYYARASVSELARMYYQYGYFKPLVGRKVGALMTFRQLVPSLFLLTLGLLAVVAPFWAGAGVSLAGLVGVYLLAALVASATVAPARGVGVSLALLAVFPVIHFAYGVGYLRGTLRFIVLERPPPDVPLSRGPSSRRPGTRPVGRPLEIAILTQYYAPEVGAAQVRLAALAEAFTAKGHLVTVLTAMPNYPTGRIYAGYPRFFLRERIGGVHVIRTYIVPTQRATMLHRLASYTSFAASSAFVGTFLLPRPDYLLVESPPLVLGLAGVYLSRVKRARLIFNVSDLFPETAVRLGVLRAGTALHRLSAWLERFCYRRAWLVTGQALEIIRDIAKRFPRCQTRLLSNGVDPSVFRPRSSAGGARTPASENGRCVAMYAGLHGLAQGLHYVLDAAERLQSDSGCDLVLVGDGPEKSALVADAARRGLTNVRFLDARPHGEMARILQDADILVVPLVRYITGAVPSKLYEAMATGRPVVLMAEGEAASIVRNHQAGLVVPPGDTAGLAEALRRLAGDPALRARLGRHGRAAVERHFDRRRIGAEFAQFLETVVA